MKMGNLKNSHLIEGTIWLTIVLVFFAFTYDFNQPIEIYKFGATGWPRVILGILLLVLGLIIFIVFIPQGVWIDC